MQAADAQGKDAGVGRERRQLLLLAAAVLLIGGVLLVRFWMPYQTHSHAIDLLRELGAEVNPRALTQEELHFVLESHPVPGKPAQNKTLAGHLGTSGVTLLHFWASWCPPCIEELPELVKLATAFHGRDFHLVAVSHDDEWTDLDAALQRATGHGAPADGTWLRDPGGNTADPSTMLRTRLGTDKLPETYVIVDGQILGVFIAGQEWQAPKMVQLFDLLAPAR